MDEEITIEDMFMRHHLVLKSLAFCIRTDYGTEISKENMRRCFSDVINAILKALTYNKQKFVIFNLGSGKTTSINQLAKIFIKLSKKKNLKPIHKKEPIGVTCSSTRIVKIRKLLGFTPSKRLEDAIRELLNNT